MPRTTHRRSSRPLLPPVAPGPLPRPSTGSARKKASKPSSKRPPGSARAHGATGRARRNRAGSEPPIRFAVVGLGYFAQAAILPAFRNARGCQLAALVSDDPAKLKELGDRHKVPEAMRFGYAAYDQLLASGLVDAVYIALPNDLHADYTVRAAKAGIHVLCEKPLATTSADARRMVEACRRADVRLMTAYRLHFEPANLHAIQAIRDGRIGTPRIFDSLFTAQVKPTGIRTEAARGGGPLYDIGTYCVNAARYLFGAEPVAVQARLVEGKGGRFREVEEAVCAILEFPDGRVAQFTASFGAADLAYYTVVGTTGYVCLDSAYEYSEPRHLEVGSLASTRKRRYRKVDQVAPELMHFAQCVRSGKDPEPSGREGLRDVRVIEAIQDAARTGRRVRLRLAPRRSRPSRDQEFQVGRHRDRDVRRLVHAQVPFRHD